ncbi:hypothetical protein ACIQMJ_26775 [Actinosynnema sp. NPDC091369]
MKHILDLQAIDAAEPADDGFDFRSTDDDEAESSFSLLLCQP